MSQIDFDSLIQGRPDLENALRFLQGWFGRHQTVVFVSVPRLALADDAVPINELAEAIEYLISSGPAIRVYRVADYDGTLLEGEYSSLSDIPDRLPDRFHEQIIDVSETDVIPGFKIPG